MLLYLYCMVGYICSQVKEVFRVAKAFFDLPLSVKEKYARSSESRNNGYGGLKKERCVCMRACVSVSVCLRERMHAHCNSLTSLANSLPPLLPPPDTLQCVA